MTANASAIFMADNSTTYSDRFSRHRVQRYLHSLRSEAWMLRCQPRNAGYFARANPDSTRATDQPK